MFRVEHRFFSSMSYHCKIRQRAWHSSTSRRNLAPEFATRIESRVDVDVPQSVEQVAALLFGELKGSCFPQRWELCSRIDLHIRTSKGSPCKRKRLHILQAKRHTQYRARVRL